MKEEKSSFNKFGYQEALFLPLKVGGYFLAGILKGKTAKEFMVS